MGMWWYVDTFNPFHLPTAEQAQKMWSYSAPALYSHLQTATYVLCPPILVQFLIGDLGTFGNRVVWVAAALLNGCLYFFLGLIIQSVRKLFEKLRPSTIAP
jgi:hypothetical protein